MGGKPKTPKPTAQELELQRSQREDLDTLTRDRNSSLKALKRTLGGRRGLLGSGGETGIGIRPGGGSGSGGGQTLGVRGAGGGIMGSGGGAASGGGGGGAARRGAGPRNFGGGALR